MPSGYMDPNPINDARKVLDGWNKNLSKDRAIAILVENKTPTAEERLALIKINNAIHSEITAMATAYDRDRETKALIKGMPWYATFFYTTKETLDNRQSYLTKTYYQGGMGTYNYKEHQELIKQFAESAKKLNYEAELDRPRRNRNANIKQGSIAIAIGTLIAAIHPGGHEMIHFVNDLVALPIMLLGIAAFKEAWQGEPHHLNKLESLAFLKSVDTWAIKNNIKVKPRVICRSSFTKPFSDL